MSAWWTSRSSMAAATTGSPKTSPQAVKGLLERLLALPQLYRVISMPDKWEYPWFAAWDLAFHTVTLALVDPAYAKEQLWLMLFEQFQHKKGQIPAYEWEFSDNNPPMQAWPVWRVYNMDRIRTGIGDRDFLERAAHAAAGGAGARRGVRDRAGAGRGREPLDGLAAAAAVEGREPRHAPEGRQVRHGGSASTSTTRSPTATSPS